LKCDVGEGRRRSVGPIRVENEVLDRRQEKKERPTYSKNDLD